MKLKLVEVNGVTYAEVQDGKPVYEGDDGKTVAFDAPGTVATISRLNSEAKTHREGKEAAEAKLKAFEGLDAVAARDAIAKVANIDAKKLIDAGEVDKVKAEISKAFEEKLTAAEQRAATIERELYEERIGGSFARSEFVKDKLAIPADFVQARFGQNFKLEEGKVVAYDPSGNKIYSRARPGEVADFDEALAFLVDAYPQKDHILKGVNQNGGGGKPPSGTPQGRTMKSTDFNALSAKDRAAFMEKGGSLVD